MISLWKADDDLAVLDNQQGDQEGDQRILVENKCKGKAWKKEKVIVYVVWTLSGRLKKEFNTNYLPIVPE